MTVAANAVAGTRASTRSNFYFYMALLCAAAAFGGFLPTFWLPMTQGHQVAPVFAIHGLVCSLWTLFFILQSWFVASGQVANHRAAGLFGIALASVMTVFGFLAQIKEIQNAGAAGDLNAGLSFSILPLWHITFFAGLVALAIINIRRPEWHRRLMLVASILILNAPLARPFIYFLGFHGQMSVAAGLPSPPAPIDGIEPEDWAVNLILVIPILYDWLKRGRPHPAYLLSGGAILLMELLQLPISKSAQWHAIASWFYSLAA